MKKILLVPGVVAVLLIAVGAFLGLKKPAQRPAPQIHIQATPEVLARGAYLVNHVAGCLGCHSKTDETKWGRPIVAGTEGGGGECWTHKIDFPGTLCAKNITSDPVHGIGKWSDGEILRAMREGVDNQGKALFNVMPYDDFAHMSDADAEAVVAYIRTLKPLANDVQARQLDFPLPIIVKFMPKPITAPVQAPNRSDSVAYGKYLVSVAGCPFCHTPVDDHMKPIAGREFSGGHIFKDDAGGEVASANLTPDPTGITGQLTKDQFIARFKAFENPAARSTTVDPKMNTFMPWLYFSGMTNEDLGAIYDYLKTVKPIHNVVTKFPQAAMAAAK